MDIYAQAIRGLLELETDPEKQLRYIDIYSALDDNEQRIYRDRYRILGNVGFRAGAGHARDPADMEE